MVCGTNKHHRPFVVLFIFLTASTGAAATFTRATALSFEFFNCRKNIDCCKSYCQNNYNYIYHLNYHVFALQRLIFVYINE